MTCSTRAMNGLMPVEGAQRPDTCAWWPRSRTRQRRAAAARPRAADTIASAIAVIAIQAGVADHALERCEAEPGRAREALQTIRAASLQALDELQATVTTLRGGRVRAAHGPAWPAGCADRHGWRRRGAGGADGRGRGPAAAARRRPGRPPDRAGGADQRAPPRRVGHGHGRADLPRG